MNLTDSRIEKFEENFGKNFEIFQKFVKNNKHLNQTNSSENTNELSAEEVSDNDCNDFDINYTNESNDETIDEIINQNIQQNSDKKENNKLNESEEQNIKNNEIIDNSQEFVENDLKYERNSQKIIRIDLNIENDFEGNETEIDNNCEESDNEFDVRQQTDKSDDKSETKSFICEWIGCKKQFKQKQHLNRHQFIHKGIQFKCDFEDCLKSFSRKNSLKKHQKSEHKLFRNSDKLRKHIDKHSDKYVCDYEDCNYRTGSRSELYKHKTMHSNVRQFKCELNDCNKLFKNEAHLRIHQLGVHPLEFEDIDWIQCSHNGCDYKTKSKSRITDHLKTHTKPSICLFCKKGFPNNQKLKQHELTHSENTDRKYRCKWYGCDKTFHENWRMKDHMNTHTAEKTFSCVWPNCDKTFINKSSLYMHKKRHKYLDYKCKYNGCEYQTTNPIRLNNHIKRHENQ